MRVSSTVDLCLPPSSFHRLGAILPVRANHVRVTLKERASSESAISINFNQFTFSVFGTHQGIQQTRTENKIH